MLASCGPEEGSQGFICHAYYDCSFPGWEDGTSDAGSDMPDAKATIADAAPVPGDSSDPLDAAAPLPEAGLDGSADAALADAREP
jgi:hypothetical protein